MLNFPNASRCYDATRRCVSFWGYEGALEVPFFIEAAAVLHIAPNTPRNELAVLASFDKNRERILDVARKVYSRRQKGSNVLIASDF